MYSRREYRSGIGLFGAFLFRDVFIVVFYMFFVLMVFCDVVGFYEFLDGAEGFGVDLGD